MLWFVRTHHGHNQARGLPHFTKIGIDPEIEFILLVGVCLWPEKPYLVILVAVVKKGQKD